MAITLVFFGLDGGGMEKSSNLSKTKRRTQNSKYMYTSCTHNVYTKIKLIQHLKYICTRNVYIMCTN